MPRLPRVTLPETLLDVAIRGGLIDVPPAVAACDAAGELVGILRPRASGRWRLRPNFQGVG